LPQNTFTNPIARKPLTRTTLGIGLTLVALGAIGLGNDVAQAAPLQPLPVDDPVPVPTPAGANPVSPVNVANSIFGELNNLLSSVFPGSSSVFMPADAGTNPALPGLSNPSLVSPGQSPVGPSAPGYPGYPSTAPPAYPSTGAPGYPTSVAPGQTPALPGYPGTAPPPYPSTGAPGQTPIGPSASGPLLPGQPPVGPGSPGGPMAAGQAPPFAAQPSPVAPGESEPVV
jgi:hypothetical protein